MTGFQTVRGMRDFLPEDLAKRRFVEGIIRELFRVYGYEEIETPTIESFDLLAAKAGEEIRQRMYVFKDLGGRRVALRPEMTAPVARIVATKLQYETKPLRLSYIANCFRYDNPQMGRYREFWQAGFELFGSDRPETDAEILMIANDLMRRLGFQNFEIKAGTVAVLRGILGAEGVDERTQDTIMGLIDKKKKGKALELLEQSSASKDCLKAIKRLFKIKGFDKSKIFETGAKVLKNYREAIEPLTKLESILDLATHGGVKCPMFIDLGFARGLEYYTGLVFEIYVPDLRIALGGGGRYNKLVELFGGEPTPAVGFSPGIDRIVLAMEKKSIFPTPLASERKVLVIPVNDDLKIKALQIASELRGLGISTESEVTGKIVSRALSYADKKGYKYCIIVGPRESERNAVVLRDMSKEEQREIPIDKLVETIKSTL